ncbi:arsenate reductase ArsC [Pseudorhodoferax sp. Leaf265]|jgi:arsenate reductase|uniref:arsenate reductase ArsC n=1 Tax=Pseudorhodoferax sp. Leaf265 TaxID=1736315 RepID=UPI0006F4B570|nr:arsenate reductase ArsC [Pseudorhodoferax sp. Leaf265]KQP11717.1 ArsC family transcriptional regulator [Pseudorhodoferax sp. Leaf265]
MTTNILILCTHNSARSVLAEGMLNHWARQLGADVHAHSAGSAPSGRINPLATEVLQAAGIDTTGHHSKSWDEFTGDAAPRMRVVITVCDSAANETCPYWPGSPVQIHWGYPDPSNAGSNADEKRAAFEATRQAIGERMRALAQLPFDTLDDAQLRAALQSL